MTVWSGRAQGERYVKSRRNLHTHTHTHTHLNDSWKFNGRFKTAGIFPNLSRLFLWVLILSSVVAVRADADDDALYAELSRKQEIYNILKADLVQIDSEMRRCAAAKRNWTAATVVGGVGVVGTGIGAIVQHNQIQDKKKELESLNQQLRSY